jgi:hypothetical protein
MTPPSSSGFKLPPVVECMSREHCLGFGKKVYVADKICDVCLRRHDPQQLREWAYANTRALSVLDEEFSKKQERKRNLEAHGRYLCAFEDPDYTHCRWRRYDLNLRGTRTDCGVVRRKGTACISCWKRHLQKVGIVQYFTPMGLCHEEADKMNEALREEESAAKDEEHNDDDEDVEGYDLLL